MDQTDQIELFTQEYAGLAWSFEVNPASCGNHSHYEWYIRTTAIADHISGKGVTYVFIRRNQSESKILGFITLRATAYTKIFENSMLGYPAMEIFELAVDKDYEGQHIGSELVKFALATAYELRANVLGIQYITLCADAQAVPFYEKFHFARVDNQGEIPREQWNVDCIPMVVKLPEENHD